MCREQKVNYVNVLCKPFFCISVCLFLCHQAWPLILSHLPDPDPITSALTCGNIAIAKSSGLCVFSSFVVIYLFIANSDLSVHQDQSLPCAALPCYQSLWKTATTSSILFGSLHYQTPNIPCTIHRFNFV